MASSSVRLYRVVQTHNAGSDQSIVLLTEDIDPYQHCRVKFKAVSVVDPLLFSLARYLVNSNDDQRRDHEPTLPLLSLPKSPNAYIESQPQALSRAIHRNYAIFSHLLFFRCDLAHRKCTTIPLRQPCTDFDAVPR